jgi:hypothetical protein
VEITRAMETEVLERALQASVADNPPQNGATATQEPAAAVAPADGAIWFAMLHGRQTGPLTRAEIQVRANEGEVGPRTYLWREGMDSWQRAKDVPELGPVFAQFPGSLLPPVTPATPVPPAQQAPGPPPAPTPKPAAQSLQPASGQTWQMGERVVPDDPGEPVPSMPAERGPADVARELFASGEHSISQKNAIDLARWATDELGRKKEHVVEQPRIAPPVVAPAPLFQGPSPGAGKGAVIIFLGLAALVGTALVLWILLSSAPEREDERRPLPAQAQTQPSAHAPEPAPRPAEPPPAKAVEPAPSPPSAPAGLSAEQVRRKLDESKPALQVCIDDAIRRDPRLRVGKIQISTTVAPTGQVTAARIDKRVVDESPLGACLKRATRRIVFPPFNGAAFDVDIPIVVTAGE